MAMPWVRLWNEILEKAKIVTLPALQFRNWVLLLCVTQRYDKFGELPAMSDVAFALRVTQEAAQKAVDELVEAGLIENNGTGYRIHDWDHWQCKGTPGAERQKKYRDRRRNALRNASVTNAVTTLSHAGARAPSVSSSQSVTEGGAGGNPPPAVANLAAATEARWPGQNADTFVGDLCRTFDHRLVNRILDAAYDKDPSKLPRAWIRTGCQNEFNRGWTPADNGRPGAAKPGPDMNPEVERRLAEWEAQRGTDKG